MKPNLQPPIKTTEEALLYRAQLQAIDPSVEYMMTLYLSPELTPDEIRKASSAGIAGEQQYNPAFKTKMLKLFRCQILPPWSDYQL